MCSPRRRWWLGAGKHDGVVRRQEHELGSGVGWICQPCLARGLRGGGSSAAAMGRVLPSSRGELVAF